MIFHYCQCFVELKSTKWCTAVSSTTWADQETYGGNHQNHQWIPLLIPNVKGNVWPNRHPLLDMWHSVLHTFSWSNKPSLAHYTAFFHCNPIECIEFHLQQPTFREYMSYTPAEEMNDVEERIHSMVKSSDRRWNDPEWFLNCIITTMILTVSIVTVAVWSCNCLFTCWSWPDISYQQFGWQKTDGKYICVSRTSTSTI